MNPPLILMDSGPLVAYYNQDEISHRYIKDFFEGCTGQFVTTSPCITEVMWLLKSERLAQHELLSDLSQGLYLCEPLIFTDFSRIAELNNKYADLPGDFADLSLIAISERLNISAIATLDKDFEIYRRFGKQKFVQVLPKP